MTEVDDQDIDIQFDEHPFGATMLPIGGGDHIVPIKSALRKAISKGIGDHVHLEITGRHS